MPTKLRITIASLSLLLFCSSCPQSAPPQEPKPEEGKASLMCGSNATEIAYRIRLNPSKVTSKHFAILLAGSPVRSYFSDTGSRYEELASELMNRGYKVFELKYPNGNNGFYSACYHQGLEAAALHSANLYDIAVAKMGYDQANPQHKLIGFGWSIGAIQLQGMSFLKGRHFDQIGLTGILLGDAVKGCQEGLAFQKRFQDAESKLIPANEFCQASAFDGLGWGYFMPYVQALTTSGNGCNQNSQLNEYTAAFNFENMPSYRDYSLGLFEGTLRCTGYPPQGAGGNDGQANYIEAKRKAAGAPVVKVLYENCGHEILECSKGKALKDVLNYFDLFKP